MVEGKKKFCNDHELMLTELVSKHVPEKLQPKQSDPLEFTEKFLAYCKRISWNRCKALGANVTKNRSVRSGMVSISSFNYMASDNFEF